MTERIFSRQFHGEERGEAWRVLPEGAYAFFRTDSFAASVRFVDAISGLVRERDDPHVDIRPDGVTVLLRALKEDGLVQTDRDLARAISTTAREMRLMPDPAAIQSLSIIPGATDRAGIMPFWQRVLGYQPRSESPDEDLVDPHGRLAPFWFEQMDELRADGAGTIHPVVWVPWDQTESRVEAALAAGGRWSGTTSRRFSGRSPIQPATRWTSRRPRRRIRPQAASRSAHPRQLARSRAPTVLFRLRLPRDPTTKMHAAGSRKTAISSSRCWAEGSRSTRRRLRSRRCRLEPGSPCTRKLTTRPVSRSSRIEGRARWTST